MTPLKKRKMANSTISITTCNAYSFAEHCLDAGKWNAGLKVGKALSIVEDELAILQQHETNGLPTETHIAFTIILEAEAYKYITIFPLINQAKYIVHITA